MTRNPHPGVLKSDVVDNAPWLRTTDITEGPRCGLSAGFPCQPMDAFSDERAHFSQSL